MKTIQLDNFGPLPSLKLGDNLTVITYESGSIGILEANKEGGSVRQLAYFDGETRKWSKNDGVNFYATVDV